MLVLMVQGHADVHVFLLHDIQVHGTTDSTKNLSLKKLLNNTHGFAFGNDFP